MERLIDVFAGWWMEAQIAAVIVGMLLAFAAWSSTWDSIVIVVRGYPPTKKPPKEEKSDVHP